jgi:hypothetical protein
LDTTSQAPLIKTVSPKTIEKKLKSQEMNTEQKSGKYFSLSQKINFWRQITEIWELAEYFDVDEEVIKFYLRLPRVKELLKGGY